MRTTSRVTAGLLAGVAAIAAITTANAQVDPVTEEDVAIAADAVTAADQQLLDTLLEVETERPPFVPDVVDVDDEVTAVTIDAAFGEARIGFDAIQGQLQMLFVDGEDAGTATGLAVSSVANGLLLEREAVTVLEEADELDIERPVDSSDTRDENDLALDADEPTGVREFGIRLLLDARLLQYVGYVQLAELDPVFADRLETILDYADTVDPVLRDAAGLPADQLIVTVDRFDAPVGEARATATSYVCVNRSVYEAATALGASIEEAVTLAQDDPDVGCESLVGREP